MVWSVLTGEETGDPVSYRTCGGIGMCFPDASIASLPVHVFLSLDKYCGFCRWKHSLVGETKSLCSVTGSIREGARES